MGVRVGADAAYTSAGARLLEIADNINTAPNARAFFSHLGALHILGPASGETAVAIPSGSRIVGGSGSAHVALRQGTALNDAEPVFEINQGNQTNVRALAIRNLGAGASGIHLAWPGSLGWMNIGPVSGNSGFISLTNRSLVLVSDNNAYDSTRAAGIYLHSVSKPGKVAARVWGSNNQSAKTRDLRFRDHEYRVQFTCENARCKGHDMSILDWGLYVLHDKMVRDHGMAAAQQKVIDKLQAMTDPAKRDAHFFLGNTKAHVQSFMVGGIYYPPKVVTKRAPPVEAQVSFGF